jgi:hypothetical protein
MTDLVPLGPDARLHRLVSRIGYVTPLLVAALLPMLLRLQLGPLGWEVLREGAAAAFFPVWAGAGLGVALLLAHALWLHRRPVLSAGIFLGPAALAVAGAVISLQALPPAAAPLGLEARWAVAGAALSPTIWALYLGAGLAAGGTLLLGARELARARSLTLPGRPLVLALAALALVSTWPSYARISPRPLDAFLLALCLLGLLIAAAAWEAEVPPADEDEASAGPLLLGLLALTAAGLLGGAETLLSRATALYAQGPDGEAYARAMALGGPRGTTLRAVTAWLPALGITAVVATVALRQGAGLRPQGRPARLAVALALVLTAVTLVALGGHRVALARSLRGKVVAVPPRARVPSSKFQVPGSRFQAPGSRSTTGPRDPHE